MTHQSLTGRILNLIHKTAQGPAPQEPPEDPTDAQETSAKDPDWGEIPEGFKAHSLMPKTDVPAQDMMNPMEMSNIAQQGTAMQTFTYSPENGDSDRKSLQFGLRGGPKSFEQARRFGGMASQIPGLLRSSAEQRAQRKEEFGMDRQSWIDRQKERRKHWKDRQQERRKQMTKVGSERGEKFLLKVLGK